MFRFFLQRLNKKPSEQMESLLTLIKIDLTYHDDMVHSQWPLFWKWSCIGFGTDGASLIVAEFS